MFNCCKKTKRKRAIPSKIDSVNLREFEQAATSADIDKVCKDLKEKKDDINKHPCKATEKNQHGAVKLEQAATSADIDKVCKDLKERKDDINKHPCLDVNAVDTRTNSNALHKVIKHMDTHVFDSGAINAINALLDAGCDASLKTKDGVTPLMVAMTNDFSRFDFEPTEYNRYFREQMSNTFEKFITKCNNLDSENKNGETALMWAAEMGLLHHVKTLVERGCSIDKQSCSKWTALRFAVVSDEPGVLEVVKYLLDQGADYEVIDNEGSSPIQEAFFSDSEIIELFLRYGCRIDFSLINFDKLMNSIISRMIPLDILETMYWYGSCSETDVLRCLENPKFILCCEPKYHKRANWLSELCSKPRTLKSNCRIAIRHCLQKALGLEKMNLLPVPSKIRQYLNHEINDEIFIDESQSEPELIEEKFEYRNIDDFYRWADQFGYF
ncbi:hypothetical protein LOTGIDRAFT_168182 [Lottia gigantea]|uniref:SOCS box domain-containing protein n=1 Tax=Lottia gigantea TaxID=225164 RepID=V4B8A2_LOTGI|nr:hypothetical protein LOTGIDRAFT_168182 [Lottia gigantea]ESO84924.1 hypothetical protein LOTGIDRAFT_168182 [Lottia gigantea]